MRQRNAVTHIPDIGKPFNLIPNLPCLNYFMNGFPFLFPVGISRLVDIQRFAFMFLQQEVFFYVASCKHSAQPLTWRHDVFCLPPPSRTNQKQYPVGLKLIGAKNSLNHIIRAHKPPLHDTNKTVGEYLTMTGNNFCKVMYVPCNRLILRVVCLSSGPHMRHCCMEHTPPKATCK